MQLKRILADIASRNVGRPSLDVEEPPSKAYGVQGNLSRDTRKDGCLPYAAME